MKSLLTFVLFVCAACLYAQPVQAHCEIPCGIYDDQLRVRMIHEHTATIAKAMRQIKELSAEGDKNYNQIVRWITNKEKHAEEIQEIVYQYFMTQRIKPMEGDMREKYIKELTLLHEILIHAMKSKQGLDESNPEKIDELLHEFSDSYFAAEAKGSH
ncbi:MAG: superoxide dismutase [Candidatus Omnitrophica bacterium]|nr:superoxide dismutase [Candidatus Omnitrophota bacterium]